jgi:hypothetical protein
LGGPIVVVTVPKLRRGEQKLMGEWNSASRQITLKAGLQPDAAAMTLFHEIVHSWLFDTGVANLLTEPQQESVCDAVALGLHRSGLVRAGAIRLEGGR